MRIALFLAGWLLSLAALPQEIYRWVDKDGVIHYADQPGAPDAERVMLQGLSEYEAQPAAEDAAPEASTEAVAAYRSLRITQPAAEEVFFGGDAGVTAVAELDGELQPDHVLTFFLDGTPLPATTGFSAALGVLERGTHVLRVAVLDANGYALISSTPLPFHVRQVSVQSPQRQPPTPPPAAPPQTQPERQPRSFPQVPPPPPPGTTPN
ncbi:MAG: DUF4124 domain-containing protein [Gammaproteobacteria bacterium]|nr:MAG: DUF4124 domain-containing protein [Gammaproteobacteria bacterium]